MFRRFHPATRYHDLIVTALHKFGQRDVRPDARSGEVAVADLGTIALSDAQLDRLAHLTQGQRVPMLESVVERFLEQFQPPLPGQYDIVPDEYRQLLQRNLFKSSLYPNGARSQHYVANLERRLGIGGWQQRMLHVAELAERQAADKGDDGSLQEAATAYWAAGELDEAKRCAEAALAGMDITVRPSTTVEPRQWARCECLILAGRWDELPDVAAEAGQVQLGPDWWSVCQAAAAAVRGDCESLQREVEAAERLSADEPLDAAGYGPTPRDLAVEMRRWLTALG